MLKSFLATALLASVALANHQVEINVNDKDLEMQALVDLGRAGKALEGTYFGGGFLNADANNSAVQGGQLDSSEIDPLFNLNFMVMRPVTGVEGLNLGLGMKWVYTQLATENYTALPLGAELEWQLAPRSTPFPVYLAGSLYYASGSLAFQQASDYLENRVRIEIAPIPGGRVEVGYRKISTNLTQGRDVTYNEAWYAGLRLEF